MKWFELSAGKVEGENIESIAPSIMEFKIPAGLAENAEVVVTGRLHPEKGKEGSVQFQLSTDKPQGVNQITAGKAQTANINGKWSDNNLRTKHTAPIVVNAASESRRRFESAFDDFRELFPAALCYAKIVPVDEVVTLTAFLPGRRALATSNAQRHSKQTTRSALGKTSICQPVTPEASRCLRTTLSVCHPGCGPQRFRAVA